MNILDNKKYLVGGIILVTIIVVAGFAIFSDLNSEEDNAKIGLSSTTALGSFLTDNDGLTLYYFSNDVPGVSDNIPQSNCLGGCVSVWPIFYESNFDTDDTLDKDQFTSFTRSDGEKQLAYRGWPLYYFAQDLVAGDTNGEGANNIWYVMKPNYDIYILNNADVGGRYLADDKGNTLYYFTKDVAGNFSVDGLSNCLGGCVSAWPLYGGDDLVLPSILSSNDFSTISRSDGEDQTTFKGWPLYYYAADVNSGDVNGEGVNAVWFVMKPDYTVMLQFNTTLNSNYLVDQFGNSLYLFTNDVVGNDTVDPSSKCLGGCLTNWPPFEPIQVIAPSILSSDDFESYNHPESGNQLAYNGTLLYYWHLDQKSGDTSGHGVGGVWFVVNP